MSQVTFGYCFVNSSESLNGRSKPVSNEAFSTTASVPHDGPVATGAAVGAAVAGAAGTSAAGIVVAVTSVAAGTTGVAGAPQEDSSRDVKINRLNMDLNTILLNVSHHPFTFEYGDYI